MFPMKNPRGSGPKTVKQEVKYQKEKWLQLKTLKNMFFFFSKQDAETMNVVNKLITLFQSH